MDPETIALICYVGISTLGTVLTSIFTVNYVKNSTSFGDKQDTAFTSKSETYYPTGILAGKHFFRLNADDYDRYAAQSVKFKNGKEEVVNNIKAPSNITEENDQSIMVSEETHLTSSSAAQRKHSKDNSGLKHETIEISDTQAILDNDAKGDQETSKMRVECINSLVQSSIQGIKHHSDMVKSYIHNQYFKNLAGDGNDLSDIA